MIRILGVDLIKEKKIYIALTYIFGIGISKSISILNKLNIDKNIKVFNLSNNDISKLKDSLESENNLFEGDLKKFINSNIKHLISINNYRGKRHIKGLPTRGQRTKTNAKTSRKKKIKN